MFQTPEQEQFARDRRSRELLSRELPRAQAMADRTRWLHGAQARSEQAASFYSSRQYLLQKLQDPNLSTFQRAQCQNSLDAINRGLEQAAERERTTPAYFNSPEFRRLIGSEIPQQQNMMPEIFQNMQFSPQMSSENISPVILNEIMHQSQMQPTRYIPLRPKKSINDKVMRNFEQNMFSPEFIPEES